MKEFIEALKKEVIEAPMIALMCALIFVVIILAAINYFADSAIISISECSTPVIVGIATIKERRESLAETLDSLIDQADAIWVHANDYVPDLDRWEYALRTGAINRDLGDTGKFRSFFTRTPIAPQYCFVCDDDLIYPPDYVAKTIAAIERHDRKAVVGYHGKLYFGPVHSYYRDLSNNIARGLAHNHRCLDTVFGPHDYPVTIIGTGCAAWHSSLFEENPLSMDDFKHPNMADIWFSKKCNDLGIPRFVIPHDAGWIRHSDKVDASRDTIAARYRNDDAVQTAVFNSVDWEV